MQEEVCGAMEKKLSARHSPVQIRNNGVTSEKKYDFLPNKNGRVRRPFPYGGSKAVEVSQSPRPAASHKWSKSFGDKRQRQKGSYDDRQREEVAGTEDGYDMVFSTGSRKGNANYLLNFKFSPREGASKGRWESYGRDAGYRRGHGTFRKMPRYNKEQFLQASCQFVVREGGEYTEQSINPDALVDWGMIELVRSFSSELITCPICLQVPFAGKITKCGHTYCWACMLHYLKLGDNDCRKCPICYDAVKQEDLKSIRWMVVPDFKVGDEIEMKLMRKNKGSVFVVPIADWMDRYGEPMNIEGGNTTKFMKLLVASSDQIKKEVIDVERAALFSQMIDAEECEACFIQIALDLLDKREASLKEDFKLKNFKKAGVATIPGLPVSGPQPTAAPEEDKEVKPVIELLPDISFDGSKIEKVYVDAFEEEVKLETEESAGSGELEGLSGAQQEITPGLEPCETASDITNESLDGSEIDPSDTQQRNDSEIDPSDTQQRNDSESSLPFGSPPSPYLVPEQAVFSMSLSLEETAENLELPVEEASSRMMASPCDAQGRVRTRGPKDTYFFYQVSTGQHIYLNSLNAQCLTKEYESLENSPETLTAEVIAIERIFMTEDVRKRLRYLNHIPLTCEFYVVELKIDPPVVSKETLKHFHAAFEKRRKARQQKSKEDRMRAKKNEVEMKKSFGIYPEIRIPLDNLNQFPSHLGTSGFSPPASAGGTDGSMANWTDFQHNEDSLSLASPRLPAVEDFIHLAEDHPNSNNLQCNEESHGGGMSFAQMLKAGKMVSQHNIWGKKDKTALSLSPSMPQLGGGTRDEASDDEGLAAPSFNSSMSDAIEQALNNHMRRQPSSDEPASTKGGKKKKRKEKQVLFSTAMARKN